MPIDRWTDKEDVVQTQNGELVNHKKNNAIGSNMDAPKDYHTKWRKPERERQLPYDNTYMWNRKDDTGELIYETETESHT